MRIYTKDLNGVTKIRRERQEYPNKRFDEAIDEKLPTVIKMRARQLLKMSRKLVNREEEGKRIAQTSGAISISMNQIIHNALNTNNQATGQI